MSQSDKTPEPIIEGIDGREHVRVNLKKRAFPSGAFDDYDIIEQVEDIRWYTPLVEAEDRALRKLVSEIRFPNAGKADDPDFFVVGLTALKGASLVRLTVRVYTRDITKQLCLKRPGACDIERESETILLGGTKQLPFKGPGACDIERESETILLGGLTVNRIPLTDDLAGGFERQGVSSCDWVMTENTRERDAIIHDINCHIYPLLDPATITLSKKSLPFYTPIDVAQEKYNATALYKLEIDDTDEHKTVFVVWNPGFLQALDWTSTPIHTINERFGTILGERFEKSGEHIQEYLRFFCDFVAGHEGPFTVIEGMDHPRFDGAILEDEAIKIIEEKVSRMEHVGREDDVYTVSNVPIWYGSAFFLATFTITRDGQIEMIDDTPILDAETHGTTDWSRCRDEMLTLTPHPLVSYLAQNKRELNPVTVSLGSGGHDEEQIDVYKKLDVQRIDIGTRGVEGCLILGDLDLSGAKAHRNLEFSYCRFRGDVNLSSIVCDSGITFENCIFEKGLRLDGARIGGGLVIRRSTIVGLLPDGTSIRASQTRAGYVKITYLATFGGIDLPNLWIDGDIRIAHLEAHAKLSLADGTAKGSVILYVVRAKGVELELRNLRAHMVGIYGLKSAGIEMFNAKTDSRVVFESKDKHPFVVDGDIQLAYLEAKEFDVSGVTVNGNVYMMYASVGQTVQFTCEDGQLSISGTVDLDYLSASTVWFSGAIIGQIVSMQYVTIKQCVMLGTGIIKNDCVATQIRCGRESGKETRQVDGLNLYGAEIEKNYLFLAGIQIAGNVNLTFARIGTGVFLRHDPETEPRNHIEGTLEMSGLTAPGGVFIEGAFIGRNLVAKSLNTGELRLKAIERGNEGEESTVVSVEVGGSLNFSQAKVTEDAIFIGLVAGTSEIAEPGDEDIFSLNLRRAEINGNLTLYMKPDQMVERFKDKAVVSQAICCDLPKGICLNQATVGADLNLSHIRCANGAIKLKDAKIGHDILIERADESAKPLEPASADVFLGNALQCGGDVDLTGLSLKNGEQPGSVILEQSIVAGRLISYKKVIDAADDCQSEHVADIPGCLNLKASEIGQVDISYHRFPDTCEVADGEHGKANKSSAEECGIVLEQARIGTLSVTYYVDKDKVRYPVPVSLKFMEVKWWDFNGSSDRAKDYIDFLGSDAETQNHTYYAIENTLLNQGLESAADEVHIAMHNKIEERKGKEREQLYILSPVRGLKWSKSILKQGILGGISGYGTKVFRPSMIIVVWWLFTGFVFSYAGNIVPSEEGLAATHTELYLDSHPLVNEWNFGSGLWVAIRYHLPIVSFGSLDEWEPTNDGELVIPNPANISKELMRVPISAEAYAYLVVAFHYILLPMAVFAASRKVIRQREVS